MRCFNTWNKVNSDKRRTGTKTMCWLRVAHQTKQILQKCSVCASIGKYEQRCSTEPQFVLGCMFYNHLKEILQHASNPTHIGRCVTLWLLRPQMIQALQSVVIVLLAPRLQNILSSDLRSETAKCSEGKFLDAFNLLCDVRLGLHTVTDCHWVHHAGF